MKYINGFLKLTSVAALAAALAACGGGGGDDAGSITPGIGAPPPNSAPTISGNPPTSITAGESYSFTPGASDPDGDTLTFSVQGNPSWMNFDPSTGSLSGTPGSGDVGTFPNISLSVSDGSLGASLAPFSVTVASSSPNPTPTPSNEAPSISGSPPTSVQAGQSFSFTPTASDPDGDTLTFSIQNRPSWLSFDSGSGQISGTPQEANVGSYSNIVISVSDGELSDSLSPFTLAVNQSGGNGTGTVTLSWSPPTVNTDGSPLTDLVGYAFYWGTSPGSYPNRIQVDSDSITTYVIEDLAPDTYYFVATAIKSNGTESSFSNEAAKEVL